jgi:CDP-diacylglycerol--glycerol-3-phosphate 3-phosphatidyltransferase
VFRQLPNLISGARILSVPVLIFLTWQHREDAFTWLLLAALLSDILDGVIARSFNLTSPLGAMLDSIGDALVMVAGAYGLWEFRPEFVHAQGIYILMVLGLWLLEMLVSFWRYGRLSSFHTYAVRVGAYALGIFVMVLLIWGFNQVIFVVAVAINLCAYLEEFVLLWLLPQWTADVRGVYWVVRERGRSD